MVKGRVCHFLKGRKRSHYRLLFLHDKSKRNKLQEQVPYPDVPSAIRPIPHGPDLPVLSQKVTWNIALILNIVI